MQLKHVVWLSLAACSSVVQKPKPTASVSDPGPVAVGTPVELGTTWEGLCEYSGLEMAFGAHWGPGEGNTTHFCKAVEHTVTITCDHDACTWVRIPNESFRIVPTHPGTLQVRATLHPTASLKRSKTVVLPPIEVKTPDSASARCHLWHDGGAQVDVALAAGTTQLSHLSDVTVRGGGTCRLTSPGASLGDPGVGRYTCPIEAQNAQLEVSTKDYALQTPVACQTVLPTPQRLGEGDTNTRFVMNHVYSYQHRDDFLRTTRERLAFWGWSETHVAETPTSTTITAEKLGSKVEIEIAETEAEYTIYTWSYKVIAGHVIGLHELLGTYEPMPQYSR